LICRPDDVERLALIFAPATPELPVPAVPAVPTPVAPLALSLSLEYYDRKADDSDDDHNPHAHALADAHRDNAP
jgi:hypothetical protein